MSKSVLLLIAYRTVDKPSGPCPAGPWPAGGAAEGALTLDPPCDQKELLREVVWVILDQFRTAVFFCCCRCVHVGNALALSIISTALPAARAVGLWWRRH